MSRRVDTIKPAVRLPRHEHGTDWGSERVLIAMNVQTKLRAYWTPGSTGWLSRGESGYTPGHLTVEVRKHGSLMHPTLFEGGRLTTERLGGVQSKIATLLELPELDAHDDAQRCRYPLRADRSIIVGAGNTNALKSLRETAEWQEKERKARARAALARRQKRKAEADKPLFGRVRVDSFQIECPYCDDGRLEHDNEHTFNECVGVDEEVETLRCPECGAHVRVPHRTIARLFSAPLNYLLGGKE